MPNFDPYLGEIPHKAPGPLEKTMVLIGFMGAGKTTVGGILSKLLRRPLVDLDEALEKSEGLDIPTIFATKGEDYFRERETAQLAERVNQADLTILAAGGGVVERAINRDLLKSAKTYYLQAPVADLWSRLTGPEKDHRPLAQDKEGFFKRFQKRKALYLAAGEPISATNDPLTIAQEIANDYLAGPDFVLRTEGHETLIRTSLSPAKIFFRLKELAQSHRLLILLDRAFLSEAELFQDLGPNVLVHFPEKGGEEAKTLREAEKLLTLMTERGLDRSDYLIAKGGGALTDLGAFTAGLFKRGLNLALWPTTLLGAVDAAIGGKTAINLLGAKNQVGHFYLPKEVWLEPQTLAEAPTHLIAEGLVEALKTGLLFDQDLVNLILTRLEWLLKGDVPLILEVARRSAWAKAQLVEKDFREEKGTRDVLNLGHTYGHAVESFNAPTVSHGRAVALGLAVALEVSKDFGFPVRLADDLVTLLARLASGFPPLPSKEETLRLLTFDKKIRDGRLKFVVLKGLAEPLLVTSFDPEQALAAADQVANRLPAY
ncbi:MAG: hypothetical protein LBS60_07895 [Deltaproteobacteria bacterium]|jgi:3-dehydroquinate synthetase|nr:hypothetical protein [Deltaproteobacteria bacterium]